MLNSLPASHPIPIPVVHLHDKDFAMALNEIDSAIQRHTESLSAGSSNGNTSAPGGDCGGVGGSNHGDAFVTSPSHHGKRIAKTLPAGPRTPTMARAPLMPAGQSSAFGSGEHRNGFASGGRSDKTAARAGMGGGRMGALGGGPSSGQGASNKRLRT